YRRVGDIPRKRHTVHCDAQGNRLHEELVGEEGFSGGSSLLYHRNSPSALTAIDALDDDRDTLTPLHPSAPLHLRTRAVEAPGGDPVRGRSLLAGNADLRILVAQATESSGLYRDAVGDQLVYVQHGDAVLESSFGKLTVRAGDYVVVPRSVCHRWNVITRLSLLIVEASSHVRPPSRYLTATGQFREHAPYCERDLRIPKEPLVVSAEGPAEVLVRTRAGLTCQTYADHPFDVVGWDGTVYPWALSIHDFEPIVGSIHQPPPVHQTFEGNGFVICSFVPRLFDFHPDAVKIPYHHSNADSDEVIYYSAGHFMSRGDSGINVGSISLHPSGFVHGPQPGSYERSLDKARTEELAVMIDTFAPLLITDTARAVSDPDYFRSWSPARD
ncbi:MAG: homogentisate 1,2-dioxygenase, partial [Acidimicrobiales bacterium]|nr:homogentisate 1,2-dioxygenase [Acidimicrobiales bacterium]